MSPIRTIFVSLSLVVALAACSHVDGVRERAAFDLACPQDKVEVVEISSFDASYGAIGCGKRATYLWRSAGGIILNSPVTTDVAGTDPGTAQPN